jgi:hypothetical protein
MRNSTEYLIRNEIPSKIPIGIHNFGLPVLIMRKIRKSIHVQTNCSKTLGVKRVSNRATAFKITIDKIITDYIEQRACLDTELYPSVE